MMNLKFKEIQEKDKKKIIELKEKLKKTKEELKKEKEELKKETLARFTALITAAFGLVAALAWNDTIKALFIQIFGKAETFWAMLVYAVIVTLIAIIVTFNISKLARK